ncbi:hypothetical protein KR009_008935, partial [Drosophila setifemur]
MSVTLLRKLRLQSMKRICGLMATPLLQGQKSLVRSYQPMAGPPRFPMSTAQRFIFGWVPLLIMMIIPYWVVCSLPRWSKLHNGIPLDEDEPEEAPPEAEEDTQKG